ncbi:MAG: NADH-quinone oxidoreductase subunit L [Planctomycetes bacterium]|nr:NADH-quinone oxidoreductase subunit L [Planctomycetota bacterium]
MLRTVYLIPLLPLLSFVLITLGGRRLPGKGSFVAIAAIGWGLFQSLSIFFQVLLSPEWHPYHVDLYDFLRVGGGGNAVPLVQIAFQIDGLSSVMLVVVTLVSFLVHVYSLGYMGYGTHEEDQRFSRFYSNLSLFSFSMLVLVLADNYAVVFMAWELVGLCSYLLIGHWFEKDYPDPRQITPRQAAIKAFLTTKVGDLGFVIGLAWLYSLCQAADPGHVHFNMDYVRETVQKGLESGAIAPWALTAVGICIFFGAIGKSAQWPLHTWLPDAMEGPTPVSALIHAATMVAAGVYLVGRIFPILTPDAGLFIAYTGGFTALFAASIALAQNDIKKVLAYSTVSQLGYMILSLGVGAADPTGQTRGYQSGLMHLTTHAMFKACLFLCSGSVIHAMHHALHHVHSERDPQDMRNMGGLFSPTGLFGFLETLFLLPLMPILSRFSPRYQEAWSSAKMPATFWTMLVATVAISGVPLFSGFISKDAILGGTLHFASEHPEHALLAVFGFGAAALTAFYMFRLIFMTFFGAPRLPEHAFEHVHESPRVMTVPLSILAVLSFWIFFNPDPTGGLITHSHGWFFEKVPAPARAGLSARTETAKPDAAAAEASRAQGLSLLPAAQAEAGHADAEGQASTGPSGPTPHGVSASGHAEGAAASGHASAHGDSGHSIHVLALVLSLMVAFSGIALSRSWYGVQGGVPAAALAQRWPWLYDRLLHKWYFDEFYRAWVVRPGLHLARILYDFDMGVVDLFVNGCGAVAVLISQFKGAVDTYIVDGLVDAVGFTVKVFGDVLRRLQTGIVQSYLVYITLLTALGVILFELMG